MKTDGVIAPTPGGPSAEADGELSSRTPGEYDAGGQPDLEAIAPATAPRDQATAPAPTTLQLTLGDFLARLPAEILRPEQRDPLLPVEIPLSQLALSLLKGRTTVPIAEIFAAHPQIFVEGVLEGPPIEIVYPWRRIVALLKEGNGSETFGRSLLNALAASRQAAGAPKAGGARFAPLARTVLRGRKMPDGQMSWFSAQPAPVPAADSSGTNSISPPAAATTSPSVSSMNDDSTCNAVPTAAEIARELARLSGERDSIMAQLDEHSASAARERADLQREHESIIATLMSEHEEALRAARTEHEREQSEQSARLAEQASLIEWNTRAIASLEADVETYRQRIKAVLQERDTLLAEKKALTREPEMSSETKPALAVHDAPAEALHCCGPAESARCRGCTHDFSLEEISSQGGAYHVAR